MRFIGVGGGSTSPESITERQNLYVKPYIDDQGYIQNAGIKFKPIVALEKGNIDGPHGIVLHRTVSRTSNSAFVSFEKGIGTHFVIDKDGAIYQCASLKRYTAHVGPIRSRCLAEGTCSPEIAKMLERSSPRQGHNREKVKSYPDRYPKNEDGVGIETVAMYTEASATWDAPSEEQKNSIFKLVRLLKEQFHLMDSDVYEHDKISRKTSGEGAGLYDGDSSVSFPPPII